MNLLLFETREEAAHLAPEDPRARHVRQVLHLKTGDPVFVGVVNGPRGKATVVSDGPEGLVLDIAWEAAPEPLHPLRALVGLPRPQTARDVLREAATLGVSELWFFRPEKGEPSYADSSLWHSDEWEKRLRQGAEQAFATVLPQVCHFDSLKSALSALPAPGSRLALDLYEAPLSLSKTFDKQNLAPLTIAIGSERGWSAGERAALRGHGFSLAHLGPRVLRTEAALIAAFSVWMAARGAY